MVDQDHFRVLIVDDIADTRESIRRIIQFDHSIEVVGMAQLGSEAVKMAVQLRPDVILMDINMPDMDGITATEMIRKSAPSVQIIILSVQNDLSYMRRAMLAGARDFLTKPPMIDELISAIHRAGTMAHEERAKAEAMSYSIASNGNPGAPQNNTVGKVVVVYSPKGGTGKTTIAANLAVALKQEEGKVLLVDGGMQFGDITVFLNEHIKNSVLDLTARVDELDAEVVSSVLINHHDTGLQILASPAKPEMAYQANGEQFGKLLGFLRGMSAYIVVDTSTYLTDTVQGALDIADIIVLITTQDIPSIKNCNLFLGLADASGIKRDKVLFVVNRFDKRISITPEKISANLRQQVKLAIPLDERIVVNSINRGVPFVHENKTFPISKTFFTLTELIREQIQRFEEVAAQPTGKI
jgi:pilus assembly protein CpaE